MSPTGGYRHARLSNGADYLQWPELFEFVISPDGRHVLAREVSGESKETFHSYLLGAVLSYSLLKHGIEPLHATVVTIDGSAIAFLGDSGFGKSTLGASFLGAGAQMLTDDLLVLKETGGCWLAYPGPPRIKLFPQNAASLLGRQVSGTPMNRLIEKLVIPLTPSESAQMPSPIKAFYRLVAPDAHRTTDKVSIRGRRQSQACLDLIANTYNSVIRDRARIANRLRVMSRLAEDVPIKALSYPRDHSRLADVIAAIRKDLLG